MSALAKMRGMSRARLAGFYFLTAAGLLLCVGCAWRVCLSNFEESLRPQSLVLYDPPLGEALIHAVPAGGDQDDMPLDSIPAAILFDHWKLPPTRWVVTISLAVCIMAATLCFLTEGAFGAIAAGASIFFLCFSNIDLVSLYSQSGYAFCILLIATLLVYRAQNPTMKKTWALAMGLGTVLLYRSVLFLLPATLVVLEFFLKRDEKKTWIAQSAVLVAVPFLFLIPWVRFGLKAHKDFSLFEYNQVESNIIAGTLGLTQCVEGDWSLLINGNINEEHTGWIYRWAAGEIFHHPFRYVQGYARRLTFTVGVHPWLFLAALTVIAFYRRRKGIVELALLAAYFVFIHCFMAVQYAYFIPLWPLLCVLAGLGCTGLARVFIDTSNPEMDRLFRKGAQSFCLAILAAALCLAAYCERAVWADGDIAPQASIESQLARALRTAPHDAWLHYELGGIELKKGRLPAARRQFEISSRLDGTCPKYRLYAAWTRAVSGEPSALFYLTPITDPNFSPALYVMRADALAREGKWVTAMGELRRAYRDYSHGAVLVRDTHKGIAYQVFNELDSTNRFKDWCLTVLKGYDSLVMRKLAKKTFGTDS